MVNYNTRLRPIKRYTDNSLDVKLPFGKTGHAYIGFETWEICEIDNRGHLGIPRAADDRETVVLNAAIGRK